MAIESGKWIMRGSWIGTIQPASQTWGELIDWIDEIGFLPPVQK